MTRNRSYIDMHRMMLMDEHASRIADIYFDFEPVRVYRHMSNYMPKGFASHPYIDGARDIIQHKMAFRTHMTNLLQSQIKTLT